MKNFESQLFLLHFAGGSRYSYQFLEDHISPTIEVHSLELPGRGKRIREVIIDNMNDAIVDYTEQIKRLRNGKPYVIYGHSMGAILGLYVAEQMQKVNDNPKRLFVTGNAGPNVGFDLIRYNLSDTELCAELKKLGGLPDEILNSQELLDFFLPIIRSDFAILEKEKHEEIKIDINITAWMGSKERCVKEIDNWTKYTTGNFSKKVLEGDHFFIHSLAEKVATELNELNSTN